jgi:hypothetical protein
LRSVLCVVENLRGDSYLQVRAYGGQMMNVGHHDFLGIGERTYYLHLLGNNHPESKLGDAQNAD